MKGTEKAKALFTRFNSVILALLVISILIAVNILADGLPWKFDMTVDKVFTLSDQTRNILHELDKSINITAFYQEGQEDATVMALLEEYAKASEGRVKVTCTDAERNPILARKFDVDKEGIFNESILFECGGIIKKVNSSDIYTLNNAYGKSFSGEQKFTGAILYVSSPKLTKVRFLEGHQETNLEEDLFKLKGKIESEACEVESLNLVKAGGVPDDTDVLVAVSPKRDLSDPEKTMLQQYLARGGRMVLLLDVFGTETKLDHFAELAKFYGVRIAGNFVVEEDSDYFYNNNNMYLVPDYPDQSIVESLKAQSMAVIFPYSLHLEILKTEDRNLIVEPLLQTSPKSWIRYDVMDDTPAKTDRDLAGPANLAVAVERDNSDDRQKNTKLVIMGNAKFVENNMLDVQGNIDLFVNSINWVQDKKEALAIRPKLINSNQMMVRGSLFTVLLIVSIVLLPLSVFGAGFVLWLRRRYA
jgi:ABC-type uncharacterized transport system involved in gliding motility auxiliary subunit